MKYSRTLLITIVALAAACGKDKASGDKTGGDKAGGGDKGGPPCTEAVAKYVELQLASGGNHLYKLKDHPDKVKEVTALLEANCAETWGAETKTCVVGTTSAFELGKCWKDAMDRARVAQVVFDYNKAHPITDAAGSGSAPAAGSDTAGSAAPATP
jgi:hypothetical protein